MNRAPLTDHALDENLPDWGVLVLESHHSPQFTMDWREHRFLKLVFVLKGRGIMEVDDRILRFQEGDLIVVPAGTGNRITDAPDAASSLYVCCVSPELLNFDREIGSSLKSGLVPISTHLANRVAAQLRRMRHHQENRGSTRAIAMVGGALRIVEWILQVDESASEPVGLHREVKDERRVMKEYVARLATEFYEATTIDAAADSIGMSRRNFTKLFHEVTGTTWLAYVRKLAINHAKHQLAQTNLAIASVAFECGFNDLSTFYRQFNSQVGMSPKKYRDSILSG